VSHHLRLLLSVPTRRSSDLVPNFVPCCRGEQAQQHPYLPFDIMIRHDRWHACPHPDGVPGSRRVWPATSDDCGRVWPVPPVSTRSEEHTSELQSRGHLVCRL